MKDLSVSEIRSVRFAAVYDSNQRRLTPRQKALLRQWRDWQIQLRIGNSVAQWEPVRYCMRCKKLFATRIFDDDAQQKGGEYHQNGDLHFCNGNPLRDSWAEPAGVITGPDVSKGYEWLLMRLATDGRVQ